MSSSVSWHVAYQVMNAPVRAFPFPHVYVEDVFPADYYRELRAQLPPPEAFKNLKDMGRVRGSYPDSRLVMPVTPGDLSGLPAPMRAFWGELAGWMLGGFGQLMISKFAPYLERRLGDLRQRQFYDEALIVQDYTTYALEPHTDTPHKVLAFLFYLPPDDALAHLGTSLYVPKDPNFLCPGGPSHPFDRFHRALTLPYRPNTLFAFLKTPNAFHGVEPIADAGIRRDLLLYDIKVHNPPELAQQAGSAQQPAAKPASSFSF